MAKYIFITGGVVSSLGKGLAAASLASNLQARGLKVRIRKLDPYLNIDSGTMSPYQHGEVFVTEDGAETDLDIGHYERFTGVSATKFDSITSGKIYSSVLEKERRGDYLGATIQVIPHVTDEIKNFIQKNIDDEDFVICEIGGTVGDIESLPFLESIRQFRNDLGEKNSLFIHVTLLPYIKTAGEIKTKPSQHSVKELLSLGIQPDMLLCRTEYPISDDIRDKLALFCNIKKENVIELSDLKSIYEAPIKYHQNGLDNQVYKFFNIETLDPKLDKWIDLNNNISKIKEEVKIAIVGKYVQLQDAYKSLVESLTHAGVVNKIKVKILWVDSEHIDVYEDLSGVKAIIVPGGFGNRGVVGKINAIKYARENNIPFLGICFGMQLAVLESVINVLNISDANSTEIDPDTSNPVIALMTEWMNKEQIQKRNLGSNLGGTMRLGLYNCTLKENSKISSIYKSNYIQERHRHRYEVNTKYVDLIESTGLNFVGFSPDGLLPEVIEHKNHPWFIGVQYHPEFNSSPFTPHPLFVDFLLNAKK